MPGRAKESALSHDEPTDRTGKRTRLAGKLLLFTGAVVGAVALAEGALTLLAARHDLPGSAQMRWLRQRETTLQESYVLDPDFGFRPRLGTPLMNLYGTRNNEYSLAKPAGKVRLLFLGDSVTFRGRIIAALREIYGEERYEYWNAGVESFNTCQEVAFYRLCNARIRPDHVILSFHNNDFESVPVAFRHEGKLVVYSRTAPVGRINPWLYERSQLYRFLVGFCGLAASGFRFPSGNAVRETGRSLGELKAMLDRDGIRLTVILLPVFKPYADWTRAEARSRREALRLLELQGIGHIDLLPALQAATDRQVPLQETAGDPWHPSRALARVFADSLRARNLLLETGSAR